MNRSTKSNSSSIYGYGSNPSSIYSTSPSFNTTNKTTKDIGVGYGKVEFFQEPRKACGIRKNNNQSCGI